MGEVTNEGNGQTSRSAQKARAEKRRVEVSRMWRDGWTWRAMADHCGVSRGTICDDIRLLRRRYAEEQSESTAEAVVRQEALINDALAALMPKVREGDLNAVGKLVTVLDRWSRLRGLDAPSAARVEVITEDAIDAAIRELQTELASNDPAEDATTAG